MFLLTHTNTAVADCRSFVSYDSLHLTGMAQRENDDTSKVCSILKIQESFKINFLGTLLLVPNTCGVGV